MLSPLVELCQCAGQHLNNHAITLVQFFSLTYVNIGKIRRKHFSVEAEKKQRTCVAVAVSLLSRKTIYAKQHATQTWSSIV